MENCCIAKHWLVGVMQCLVQCQCDSSFFWCSLRGWQNFVTPRDTVSHHPEDTHLRMWQTKSSFGSSLHYNGRKIWLMKLWIPADPSRRKILDPWSSISFTIDDNVTFPCTRSSLVVDKAVTGGVHLFPTSSAFRRWISNIGAIRDIKQMHQNFNQAATSIINSPFCFKLTSIKFISRQMHICLTDHLSLNLTLNRRHTVD